MIFFSYRRVRLLLVLALSAGVAVWAQRGDRQPIDRSAPPEHWEIAPSPVLSPEETIATFELPDGFRAELVAAEPIVQDPIAVAFEPDGRIWVVEYPAYNWRFRNELYEADDPPPPGRIVVVEDSDGDGIMDRRTVFLEGLAEPRSVLPVLDGVLVVAPPYILFARDTTGDGKADEKVVVADDLGEPGNPHSAPNTIAYALDNWIYGGRLPGRFRHRDGEWVREEPVALRGQWGMSQDDYGRLFYSRNQDHLRGDLVPPRYWQRNPNFPLPAGLDVRLAHDQTVWPHSITPGVNRRAQLRDDGRLRIFTANSGPVVYRGDQFPEEFYGDVFLGEPAGNLLRRGILTERDGIISAENAYDEREFLFSTDERFRPVHTYTAPDGTLFVVDMYRGVIEGQIFVTTFLRNQILDRELHRPFHGMGRIYRIVHEHSPRRSWPRAASRSAAEWVEDLGHPNGWWRDTAQRRIVESGDASVTPSLREMALRHPDHRSRIHALWSLEGLRALDRPIVEAALEDSSFRVRKMALRLAEPWLAEEEMLDRVLALTGDPRIEVRRQLLYTLGEASDPRAESAIVEILFRDGEEPFMAEAAVSSLHRREWTVLQRIWEAPDWKRQDARGEPVIAALATAVFNEGRPARVELLVSRLEDSATPGGERNALLSGLVQSEGRFLAERADLLRRLMEIPDEALRERVVELAARLMPERPPAEAAGASVDATEVSEGEQRTLMELGREQFLLCAACHRDDGQGLGGIAPPLVNSPWVLGSVDLLIRILLQGMDSRTEFPDMPPMQGLTNEQLAAVLTYVRNQWGHRVGPVTPGQVERIREATSDRQEAWTEEELRALSRR